MNYFGSIALLTTYASILCRGLEVDRCQAEYEGCRFSFGIDGSRYPTYDICEDTPSYGEGFTDAIVSKDGENVFDIFTFGRNQYLEDNFSFENIGRLNSDLIPTQFEAVSSGIETRIGHQPFQFGSRMSVKGGCFKISLNKWKELDEQTGEIRDVFSASDDACIVFAVGYCYSFGDEDPKLKHLQ
mmetsp:Transcript_2400/g.3471  ORF Transcript_2400/g.3471 Transcript_2400/m.3471 type:complete len:185 (+) Transcript_2400:58-612(+)